MCQSLVLVWLWLLQYLSASQSSMYLCLQHRFEIIMGCYLRFFWGTEGLNDWPCVGRPGMLQKTWISQIHTDALSSESSSLCSENDRCIRKHVTQPHRLGEKVAKAVSNWIYERNLGRKNAIPQFGSNPGLKALKPSGWNVPQPLNDLVQKHKRYVSTKTRTAGHFPSSALCWISASEITTRDVLIKKNPTLPVPEFSCLDLLPTCLCIGHQSCKK